MKIWVLFGTPKWTKLYKHLKAFPTLEHIRLNVLNDNWYTLKIRLLFGHFRKILSAFMMQIIASMWMERFVLPPIYLVIRKVAHITANFILEG